MELQWVMDCKNYSFKKVYEILASKWQSFKIMLVCSEIGNEMVTLELRIHGRNKLISQLVLCEHHPSFLSA